MSGALNALVSTEVDQDVEDELDSLTEHFIRVGPEGTIVLHWDECSWNKGYNCDCTPRTLKRGAKA